MLKEKGYSFDVCFTSVLKRAITTFNIIGISYLFYIKAEEMDLQYIPVIKSWRLNERHYGYISTIL